MFRTALLVSFAAALAACGGPSTQADAGTPLKCHEYPFNATGAPTAIDAQLTSNVFAVPLTVGATQKTAVVDTGAPVTVLDPSLFTSETLPMGQGTVASMSLGGLTAKDVTVVATSVGASTGDGPLPGLVGGDFLCHFATSFDYRQPRVLLGDQALPTDLAAPVTVAAPVKGGGTGALPVNGSLVVVQLPPTRVVVTAKLEGVDRTFVLDSGASMTVVSPTVFGTLVDDGRKKVGGLAASTVMGSTGLTLTRAKTLSLGGAEVPGVLVASLDSTNVFTALSAEVKQNVDGLIGGTFLREFLVTVDYAGEQVLLRRYPARDHVHDEFTRVGVALAPIATAMPGQPHYEVQLVFPGSDAETQGLKVGDDVISIDGTSLEPLDLEAASALLLGAAGTTKALETPSGTLMVKVEDLLGN